MPVMKQLDLVGASSIGWQEAVNEAIVAAARPVRNIQELEVVRLTARVDGHNISEYRAEVKVGFVVEREG